MDCSNHSKRQGWLHSFGESMTSRSLLSLPLILQMTLKYQTMWEAVELHFPNTKAETLLFTHSKLYHGSH